MNANKALWEKGDFTRIAQSMRQSGEDLVRQARITPGMRVLDLGCGDGTTAIPAAKLGARVLGVDIAANLVAAGSRRAAHAGLAAACSFLEGDACDLGGLENKSFDLVISIFGAMFAPRPFDVAREMVRVTRPGGRIIMGNWIPDDPTLVAQILRAVVAAVDVPVTLKIRTGWDKQNRNAVAVARMAEDIGVQQNIAIVDAGNNLVAFAHMDGAWLGSIDIAIKKAHTARWFDMPTGEIGKLSQPGGTLYNIEHSNGGLITFPGGLPIKSADGTVIGAIGVSGSTVENDHTVAAAGAAAIK